MNFGQQSFPQYQQQQSFYPQQGGFSVPANYKWSPEAAAKAGQSFHFIRVGGDSKSTGKRLLSGAEKGWVKEDKPKEFNAIFSLTHRITGTPEDVRYALQSAGRSLQEVEDVIANSVTRNNYKSTKAGEYMNEINSYERFKSNDTENVSSALPWGMIVYFAQNYKRAEIIPKGQDSRVQGVPIGNDVISLPVAGVSSRSSSGEETKAKGVSRTSFPERVSGLKHGKVLDVSKLDERGVGAHAINIPKGNSRKLYIPGLPFASSNLEGFITALRLYYGPDAEGRFANEINQLRQIEVNRGVQHHQAGSTFALPSVSPSRRSPTRRSPSRRSPTRAVPGSRIAASPNITAMPARAVPGSRIAASPNITAMPNRPIPGSRIATSPQIFSIPTTTCPPCPTSPMASTLFTIPPQNQAVKTSPGVMMPPNIASPFNRNTSFSPISSVGVNVPNAGLQFPR